MLTDNTHTTPGSCTGSKDDCDDTDLYNFPGNLEVCDGSDNNCDSIVDDPVKLRGKGKPHTSIQSAYDDISGGTDTIEARSLEFGESLILDRNVIVTLKGGYDCTFPEPSTGWTTIAASGGPAMVISNGTVIVEYIILQ